ncbi:cyclophilin-like protein [Ceraceosorus guamensis]|uniref:Peptidyl-prolyl cis-trans isomerase n=1 Tax=Ceraceosorus guamensis TaxID=1522189 RepID=A0A316VXB5_9BASI|nr:cyclophilin-like protein [Ceraceosorus guamensis]PWN42287.1 cyclophilin-like protein [Ceraceosorus guamensis]
MSVLLETSVGDIVIDLETKLAPKACENFLKLGAAKKYNFNSFFSVQRDFLAQAGDPSSKQDGRGGVCFWNTLPPDNPAYSKQPYFVLRKEEQLNHRRGTVSFALSPINGPSADGQDEEEGLAGSQFFICLTDDASYLDGKHAVFGNVVEGQEEGGALDRINTAYVDEKGRPLLDIRIKHVEILEDPFSDPPGYVPPSRTPSPTPSQLLNARADASEELVDPSTRPAEEVEREKRKADSSAAALTLEMVGDLPHADVRPPENVLFVCKLNPVTRSEDLQLIFSRFGVIMSCEVIRDRKTGDSLQYAFIEFDEREQAEQAYFKMQNVLVDDRRIWVDFSQSVGKLHQSWMQQRTKSRAGSSSARAEGSRTHYDQSRGQRHDLPRRDAPSRTRDDRRYLAQRDRHDSYGRGGNSHRRHEYGGSQQGRDNDRRSHRDHPHAGDRDRDRRRPEDRSEYNQRYADTRRNHEYRRPRDQEYDERRQERPGHERRDHRYAERERSPRG